MALVKKKVMNLPPLEDLITRLEDVADKNLVLMSMAGLQEDDLVTIVDTVSD